MKILNLVAFFLIAHSLMASSGGLPLGEWHHADLRSVEVALGGMCVRLWLEERTYSIISNGESRFTGTYFNIIRAAPVGVLSHKPDCRFPAPAENPVASQFRGWSVIGDRSSGQAWRVRAEPGPPGGDLRVFEAKEFETALYRQGELLADSTGASDDSEKTLLFRPPAPPPTAARAALEDMIRRLHGGACLEMTSKLGPALDAAREICALRQRAAQITGSLVSISVDGATEFDRVPVGFPRTPSNGYRRQRGVFLSFDVHYENQKIPGDAVVFEEEGAWNVVVLWF